LMTKAPPAAEFVVPTTILIPPALPPVALPVAIMILPVFPFTADPVVSRITPDDPAEVEEPVYTSKLPELPVLDPEMKDTEPDEPLEDTPVARVTGPAAPACVFPELSRMLPPTELEAAKLSPLRIVTAPVDPMYELPETIARMPPVPPAIVDVPADNTTLPPWFEFEAPTTSEMAPADPLVAVPDAISMEPDAPLSDVPVLRTILPELPPPLGALAVRMAT
jgi:hypothetical protein